MLDDVRHVCRALLRAPGFTGVAVLTIALAVGANTAIFSIADAVLFRPFPFRDPASLFVIQMRDPATAREFAMVRWSQLRAIRDHHRGVGDVATIESGPTVIASTAAGPEYVRTAAVSPNYFETFGATPARGRLFGKGDAATDSRTAVMSYDAWQSRFGGDEAIVGRPVAFGPERFDIVGILPRGFVFPTPLVRKPELVFLHDIWDGGPNSGALYPVVRLEPGTTPAQADAELASLAEAMRAADPALSTAVPVLREMRAVLFPAGRPIMRFLLAAALLVLLIGCANLANLFLARAQRQQRDLGIRAALGASRMRILRPLVLEAALIGMAGAGLAVAVTALSFDALIGQVPPIAYGSAMVGVDLRVGAFAMALGCVGAGLFAMLAAWRVSRLDLIAIIQRRLAGSPAISRRFGQPMVAAQVAIAVVLVFGAAVAGRALFSILQVPLGFTSDRVISITAIPHDVTTGREFYTFILDRLRGHADVVSAGAGGALPLSGMAMGHTRTGRQHGGGAGSGAARILRNDRRAPRAWPLL
jgi:putative ABC transport system permease protein